MRRHLLIVLLLVSLAGIASDLKQAIDRRKAGDLSQAERLREHDFSVIKIRHMAPTILLSRPIRHHICKLDEGICEVIKSFDSRHKTAWNSLISDKGTGLRHCSLSLAFRVGFRF